MKHKTHLKTPNIKNYSQINIKKIIIRNLQILHLFT